MGGLGIKYVSCKRYHAKKAVEQPFCLCFFVQKLGIQLQIFNRTQRSIVIRIGWTLYQVQVFIK